MAVDRAGNEPELGGDSPFTGGGLEAGGPAVVPAGPRCRRCGYELRGLPLLGECPECALSVQRSLRGNLLEYSDPAYLRRVGRGAGLVVLGVLTLCALPLGALGWVIVMAAADLGESFIGLGAVLGALACVGAGVLGLVGLFLLTSRDPGFVGRDASDRSRLVTRIATVVTALGWGVGAALSATPALSARAPAALAGAGRAIAAVLLVTVCVQLMASVYYMRHVASRVPSARLEQKLVSIKNTGVALGVCLGLVTVLAATPLGGCVGPAGGVVALVLLLAFVCGYGDAVDWLRRELSRLEVRA